MSGTVLGKDQILKINAFYARILEHVKSTLTATATPFDKMRAYVAMEYVNTTELAEIFSHLPFISPAEKRALVRAAIDDVRHEAEVPGIPAEVPATDNAGVVIKSAAEELKAFTPPAFKLNVVTTHTAGAEGMWTSS